MGKQEEFKKIDLCDRNFMIRKFDALTGSYMLCKVGGIISSIFTGTSKDELAKLKDKLDSKESDVNFDFAKILKEISKLPEEDFRYIQTKCLQVCFEELQAGPAQVFTKNETWGIMNADTKLAMGLTIHALMFNVMDFFGGSLSSLLAEDVNLPQQ